MVQITYQNQIMSLFCYAYVAFERTRI